LRKFLEGAGLKEKLEATMDEAQINSPNQSGLVLYHAGKGFVKCFEYCLPLAKQKKLLDGKRKNTL
jgi:hypothetical protein